MSDSMYVFKQKEKQPLMGPVHQDVPLQEQQGIGDWTMLDERQSSYRTQFDRHMEMSRRVQDADGKGALDGIKQRMGELTELLQKPMYQDGDAFQTQLTEAERSYQRLILACDAFEENAPLWKSATVRARLRMVKEVKKQAEQERMHFADIGTAMRIHADWSEGMILGNLLGGMLANYRSMKEPAAYDSCVDDGDGHKYKEALDDHTKHMYDCYYEKDPGYLSPGYKKAISVTRMMDFLGVGKLNRRSELIGCKDGQGKWHYGMRTARYYDNGRFGECENVSWNDLQQQMNERRQNSGRECSVEYSPEAIRHLSILQMVRMLAGADNPNDHSNLVFSYVTKAVDNKIIYTIDGVFMDVDWNLFGNMTGKDLEKGSKRRPSMKLNELPMIDAQFADAIMAMEPDDFNYLTADLMSKKQQAAFASRLRWMQGELVKKWTLEKQKPSEERSFIKPGAWESPELQKKLEQTCAQPDKMFPGVMGQDVKIEGAGAPAGSQERIYAHIYATIRGKIKAAKDPKEAFHILSRFAMGADYGALDMIDVEGQKQNSILNDLRDRITSELLNEDLMRCMLEERFEAQKALVTAYEKKAKEIAAVPEEFLDQQKVEEAIRRRVSSMKSDAKNKGEPFDEEAAREKAKAKTEEALKKEYICYLLQKEEPSLFVDLQSATILQSACLSGVSFVNRTMDVKYASPADMLVKMRGKLFSSPKYEFYRGRIPEIGGMGDSLLDLTTNYSLIKDDKIQEVTDVFAAAAKKTAQETFYDELLECGSQKVEEEYVEEFQKETLPEYKEREIPPSGFDHAPKEWGKFVKEARAETISLKCKILFRISNEGEARKAMEKVRAQDRRIRRSLWVIRMLTKNNASNIAGLSERKRQAFDMAVDVLLRTKEEQKAYGNEIRALFDWDYTTGKDAATIEREERVYRAGLKRLWRNSAMNYSKAEYAYDEERLRAKRPKVLEHFEQTREEGIKDGEKKMDAVLNISGELHGKMKKTDPNAPKLSIGAMNEMANEYLNDVLSQPNAFQIRVSSCKALGMILNKGRFPSGVEENRGKEGKAKSYSAKMFGTDPKTMQEKDYEVYGYLSHGDTVKESRVDSKLPDAAGNMVGKGVQKKGQVIVTLKKDRMMHRTTMLFGSSLINDQTSHPVSFEGKKDIFSMGENALELMPKIYEYKKKKDAGEDVSEYLSLDYLLGKGQFEYTELQFHGGVTIDDIESVTLLGDYASDKQNVQQDTEIPQNVLNSCRQNEIKTFVIKDGTKTEVK